MGLLFGQFDLEKEGIKPKTSLLRLVLLFYLGCVVACLGTFKELLFLFIRNIKKFAVKFVQTNVIAFKGLSGGSIASANKTKILIKGFEISRAKWGQYEVGDTIIL